MLGNGRNAPTADRRPEATVDYCAPIVLKKSIGGLWLALPRKNDS
jgi:hypothetical protein